ncbi:hypothetical protein LguiA_022892 [Lonicera macranthoides]
MVKTVYVVFMQMKYSVWLVLEMMKINCTTFSCTIGLHQNVENNVNVNYILFIYNTNQTHCLTFSLQTKSSPSIYV